MSLKTPDGVPEVNTAVAAAATAAVPAGAVAGAAAKTEGNVPVLQSAEVSGSTINIGASPLTGLRALHIATPTGYYFQPTTVAPLLQSGMRFVYGPPLSQGPSTSMPHVNTASNSSSIDLESPPSSPSSISKKL